MDIHSLVDSDETILRTQFFNILSWCWNEISRDRNEQVILVCDEAHLLIDPNNKDGVNSWYYIPANLKTGDTFEFIVKNTNLSLIKGVNFTYNATCSVKGKNEIHDSNKIKYRSIDTSNPFPKATKISDYPKNWQQYVNDKGLNRIISNSFSGISYQTNFFKNKSYIDGLKITYGDYYSYNDMDTNGNGTSAIIHKENLFSKINGNYNKAGEYKEEKDKVQS